MPGDELSRIREYEKLGNKYLAAGDRALKQLQIANAPMMKYLDAVDCWRPRQPKVVCRTAVGIGASGGLRGKRRGGELGGG